MLRLLSSITFLALLWVPLPGNAAESAEHEIGYLLDFVASSGCTFTRNGADHDSAEAADHLRLKYQRGRRYATSAENFIDRLASKSSWTGKAYTVSCDDGIETSSNWLHRALAAYRRQSSEQ